MKTKLLLRLATILPISLCLHAQEVKAPVELKSATAYIPGTLEVRIFTPPAPVVQKRLPAIRIEATTTTCLANGKTLTIQRGEPSTEPDLPLPPPPAPPTESRFLTQQEIADNIWHQRHNINLGATIFDHQTSVIHWTDPVSLVRYEAVCGFDVGLLAGLGGFVHRGEDYSLFLMHSHQSTTEPEPYSQEMLEETPKIAPGEIRITTGDATDPHALALLQTLREVIDLEKPRLIPFQAARKQYEEAAQAWHTANPPVPKDETFVLRPHRGSRYLTKGK
jgi:hypothetical protein